MTSPRSSWWFFLACSVVLALLWTTRREYHACDLDGCMVANRWTGAIYFQPALYGNTYEDAPSREVRLWRAAKRPPVGLIHTRMKQ